MITITGICRAAGIGLLCALPAACGGGGGGSGITPPPQISSGSPLDQIGSTVTYTTTETWSKLSIPGDNSGVDAELNPGNSSVTVGPNFSSFEISVNNIASFTGDNAFTRSFGSADINAGASNSDRTVYENDDGTFDYSWAVRLPGRDDNAKPEHVTFGRWERSEIATGDRDIGFLTFGQRAPANSLPSAGLAVYNGVAEGVVRDGGGITDVRGTAEVTVVFDTRGVSLALRNMQYVSGTGPNTGAWRDLNGQGTITSGTARFSGTASTTTGGLTGDFNGAFFGGNIGTVGPEEVGGTWLVGDPGTGPEVATGAFIAEQ